MASRLCIFVLLQMLVIFPICVLSEDHDFQAGGENFGVQGGVEVDPDAGFEEKTWKGGEKPKCKNNIDRNMRDCEEEEQSWGTEQIIGAVVLAALFVFGLVLGILDYRWAPADNKLSPRCQKPEGCALARFWPRRSEVVGISQQLPGHAQPSPYIGPGMRR